MSDFHQALNAARKCVSGVFPLRVLARGGEEGVFLSTGLGQLDELLEGGGLPVGRISEFYGPASAGKTSLVGKIMAGVTSRGGCVAYVDCFNALAPEFLERAGVDLENVLWVRGPGSDPDDPDGPGADGEDGGAWGRGIHGLKRAVRQAEILIQSGNFTLVVLDVADQDPARAAAAASLPGTAWFRLQRAAEKSQGVLILLSGRSLASGASARAFSLAGGRRLWGKGRLPLAEAAFPFPVEGREKSVLLLGMEGSAAVTKGGRNGRSVIFHCHL